MPGKITYVTDENGEVLIRKKKKHKKHSAFGDSKKATKIILIILAVIAFLIALYFVLLKVGEYNMKVHYDEGKIIEHNGHKYQFNENLVTLSFIGYDQNDADVEGGRNGQADFLLIMALDTVNSTLKGISIPRDTMVEPNDYSGAVYFGIKDKEQIAVSFSYSHDLNESCEKTSEAMSRLMYNMPIKYYFGLNFEGIGPINDAVGGITLTALETIPSSDIIQGHTVDLFGTNAQKYVQWRDKSVLESSQLRRQRDDQYMKCFYEQAKHNISDIYIANDVFNSALKYASTNLGIPEFLYLAQLTMTQHVDTFFIKSINGQLKQGQSYAEFWPDNNDIFEKMLDIFYLQIE